MSEKIKNYLGIAAILAILSAVAIAFWTAGTYSKGTAPARVFTVRGEGKATAVPDIAKLTFSILTEGGTNLTELQKNNSQQTNRLISFLKQQGVDEKDIRTQSYNIMPRREFYDCVPSFTIELGKPEPCPPPKIVGYRIQQSLSVKVRDLNKVGKILAGAVKNGANNVSGPAFDIDNPEAIRQKARQEAIAKAQAKAEAMAKAGGFKLGRLVSVSETFMGAMSAFQTAVKSSAESDIPQIEPGSSEVKVSVELVYEIR